MAVGYWVEAMSRDVDKAVDEATEAQLHAAVADFMGSMVLFGDHTGGSGGAREKTWINR
jgi:hypothetical protein